MNAYEQHFKTSMGVANRYKLFKYSAVTGELLEETPWCSNLIVNDGIDFMFGRGHGNPAVGAAVGTSSATPTAGDTGLVALLAKSSNLQESPATVFQTTTLPYYAKRWGRFRFNTGTVTGNLAEVGMYSHYASTLLVSRALIVDAAGNPTTLTLAADEFLDVVWEFYVVPLASKTGTFNMFIDGVSTAFSYEIRPIGMSPSGGWSNVGPQSGSVGMGIASYHPRASASQDYTQVFSGGDLVTPVTTLPTGTAYRNTTAATEGTHSNGTATNTARFNFGLAEANAPINVFKFNFDGVIFQMKLNNPVVKVATKTFYMDLTITVTNVAVPTN